MWCWGSVRRLFRSADPNDSDQQVRLDIVQPLLPTEEEPLFAQYRPRRDWCYDLSLACAQVRQWICCLFPLWVGAVIAGLPLLGRLGNAIYDGRNCTLPDPFCSLFDCPAAVYSLPCMVYGFAILIPLLIALLLLSCVFDVCCCCGCSAKVRESERELSESVTSESASRPGSH